MVLLDIDGMPLDSWLRYCKRYKPSKKVNIVKFIKFYLKNGWHYGGVEVDGNRVKLSTYGWSGNELVIDTLLKNENFVNCFEKIEKEPGGHYILTLK